MCKSRWLRFPVFVGLVTLWFALLSTLTVAAPSRADAPPAPFTTTITLRAGHVWIDGTLNGQPAHFILDSGAGGMLVTPAAAQRCGLLMENGKVVVQGAIPVGMQRTVAPSIGVGAALLTNQEAFVAALPEQLTGCDGFLGYPFLARFAVRIEYDKRLCTIGGTPAISASATKGAETVWLPITFDENTPIIDGAVDGQAVRLRVDTGDDAAAMLLGPFIQSHHLRDRFTPRLETITGRGIGGFLRGDIVRVPTLTLGSGSKPTQAITLHRVITELSRQNTGGFYSSKFGGQIGAEVLEHFTVTFDYARKRVGFTPNRTFDAPFVYNRAGLNIDEQNGRFVIVDVIPDSPAAEVGLERGDEIRALDGVPASQLTAVEFHDRVRGPVGTTIKLTRQRDGQVPTDVAVTLRDLL